LRWDQLAPRSTWLLRLPAGEPAQAAAVPPALVVSAAG
jgi:hypothetical protein